jgi:hypothetical protein
MTARLVHEQAAYVVETRHRVTPPVEDGRTGRRLDTPDDDAEGLARGVVVNVR